MQIKDQTMAKQNYKLYNTLRKLEREEVWQVKKLLQSPFFVFRKDVGKLFNCLYPYVLKDKTFPSKERVFAKVFPQRAFNDGLLRGVMSDLFELIEEYFLIMQQRKDTIQTRNRLAEIYRNRELSKCYQGVIKKTEELLEKYPQRNEFYYRQLLDFQKEKIQFELLNQRTKSFNLDEVAETMDILYLMQKLKHTCIQFTHQKLYKTTYDYGILSNLLDLIDLEKYLKIPAIGIYYYCYLFLTEEDGDEYFQKFKEVLFQHSDHFDQSEIKILHLHAINFCIGQANRGRSQFREEILELYKDGLETGYLIEDGQISRFTYNNIVGAGTSLKEFEWSQSFIEDYASLLDDDYRDSTVSFNMARLEYSRKNYKAALLHLQNTEYEDVLNTIIAKTMVSRIYYEEKTIDALLSHLDSFQIYIRRKDVSDFYRKNVLNNIRYLKNLVSLTGDKKQINSLRKEIENEAVLTEKSWLLDQLNER